MSSPLLIRWDAVRTRSLPFFKNAYCFFHITYGYFIHKDATRWLHLFSLGLVGIIPSDISAKYFFHLIIFFFFSIGVFLTLFFITYRLGSNQLYFLMVLKKCLKLIFDQLFSIYCVIPFRICFSLVILVYRSFVPFHTFSHILVP